jgi:hypothetical protein
VINKILAKYLTLKFDDDRWRTVSLKNQIFILCPGQQTLVLQISSNIPSILSSCSRLFAIKNTHFARNIIFGHVAKSVFLLFLQFLLAKRKCPG